MHELRSLVVYSELYAQTYEVESVSLIHFDIMFRVYLSVRKGTRNSLVG